MTRDDVAAALHEALVAGRCTSGSVSVDVAARWRRLCEGRAIGTPDTPDWAGERESAPDTAPAEGSPDATSEADPHEGRHPHG